MRWAPCSNYTGEGDDNKQQSCNGWDSGSKAKQPCHSVKESSRTVCPVYKGLSKIHSNTDGTKHLRKKML